MTYDEFINNIIITRGQWNVDKSRYWEGHHIIPKCLGGEGTSKKRHPNIIWLYPDEHFTAHKLLLDKYPGNFKLIAAFWYMCNKEQYSISTPEEYKQAKELYSKRLSEILMGHVVSNETRQKLHQANLGQCPWSKGKHLTVEHRAKISEKSKLRGMPIAGWNKGKKMAELGIDMINYGMTNKTHTEETKKKLSKIKKGTHPKTEWPSKQVRCIETGIIYVSVCEAKRQTGINHIDACCRGERLTAGGYHWEYVMEDSK